MEKELNEELEREEKRRFVSNDEDDFDIDNLLEELESLTDEEYEAKQKRIREENYRIVKGFE
jgi:hypothetical protein